MRPSLLTLGKTFIRPRVLRSCNAESISHVARDHPLFPTYIASHNTATLRDTEMTSVARQDQQDSLQDVTKLSDHVIRVLGQNPGKLTLQGTNTYLIGSQKPYILVDAAEGLESYIPILTSALQDSTATTNPSAPDVSDIIISHWHHDHVGGLPSVLSLLKSLWVGRNHGREAEYQGPKMHKYPFDETKAGEHLGPRNILPDIEKTLHKGLYTAAPDGSIFHDLYDGQTFVDKGTTLLEVLHTPGHTVDSICLYLPLDRVLYTADTVLGHGTAVFEDLSTYMASLNKMLGYHVSASAPLPSAPSLSSPSIENQGEAEVDSKYDILYPGHGAILTNGPETIATYIKHRMEREAQIVEVLKLPVPVEFQSEAQDTDRQQRWTIWNLVRHIYKSYPENLWLPATRSVHLHLKKLEGEGFVRCVGGEEKDTIWELVTIPSSLAAISNL